ncbi:hypothetical protein D3C76_1197370 [compost metagenome]
MHHVPFAAHHACLQVQVLRHSNQKLRSVRLLSEDDSLGKYPGYLLAHIEVPNLQERARYGEFPVLIRVRSGSGFPTLLHEKDWIVNIVILRYL